MPLEATVNQGEQDYLLKIAPTTAKGNPAEIENPEYIVESPEGIVVEVAEDGKSAKVITQGVGDITGRTRVDADLGEGVVHIEDTFIIHVVSPQAANVGLTGEPVEKVA
jgi:hypothetical protein